MKNLVWMSVAVVGAAWGQAPVEKAGGVIDLPNSKQIHGVAPGAPQRLNSLPVAMAVSPDGRYVVTVNGGYGSFESKYEQSLAVMDTRTGKVTDFPDARTGISAKQDLFSGLAFSSDGKTLYGSIVSTADARGLKAGDTGTGIQVYGFADGVITRERVMKIAPQPLAAGRTTTLIGGGAAGDSFVEDSPGANHAVGMPYPAAIAIVTGPRAEGLGPRKTALEDRNFELVLVAGNLSDDVLLMDGKTGQVVTRFDLSENVVVPSVYPAALVVAKDGRRAFVALWNASEVVELDLVKGTVGRKMPLMKNDDPVRPGSHPDAVLLSPDGKTLYVALGNRDAVAAVDVSPAKEETKGTQRSQSSREDREDRLGEFRLTGYFDTRLPGQSFFGAEPNGLATNADGSRLYVSNMGTDAVAVIDTHRMTKGAVAKGEVEPIGFVPTEWLPMGVLFAGGKLYIATGKGTGTGPNNSQQVLAEGLKTRKNNGFVYIPTLLHGSMAVMDASRVESDLKALTAETLVDERLKAAEEKIAWDPGVLARLGGGGGPTHHDEAVMNGAPGSGPGPIRHVIYIIRENRTYDQILGDLPVGNGDKSLTMYGKDVTPNMHKLVMQFGVLDNFYDSAEVSGEGHVWSNTAIGTDYLERTWQLNYRNGQRGYDYEGVVSSGVPLEQRISDVNEPGSGYIWGNLAKHGLTLYHFGEYISSKFCAAKKGEGAQTDPTQGPMLEGSVCSRAEVKPGEKLPEVWGGGVNKWPWPIPLIASNTATKPELVGHFAAEAPDFNLKIPDQIRADIFLRHLDGWIADKKAGKDTMPNFVMLRIPNDHTNGTTAGGPTPRSSVADNDLAVGRAVEAVSNSPFWDDTAFFILEDDAQNGADHVDAHRSLGVIVSKYAPHAPADKAAFVDSRFYSTVSMVRTMETVLGLPPMNNNDALSSLIGSLFTGPGDQAPFVADRTNDVNGMIYEANKPTARGARASAKMDFSHADRADSQKLNVILWQDAMGDAPVPAMLLEKRKKVKDADDQ